MTETDILISQFTFRYELKKFVILNIFLLLVHGWVIQWFYVSLAFYMKVQNVSVLYDWNFQIKLWPFGLINHQSLSCVVQNDLIIIDVTLLTHTVCTSYLFLFKNTYSPMQYHFCPIYACLCKSMIYPFSKLLPDFVELCTLQALERPCFICRQTWTAWWSLQYNVLLSKKLEQKNQILLNWDDTLRSIKQDYVIELSTKTRQIILYW